MLRTVLPVIVALLAVAPASGQLLSPTEFLGYAPGEHFTPHHRVTEYVRHVATESPLVSIEQYGETNERRPLNVLFVSDLVSAGTLEAARHNNLAIAQIAGNAESAREQGAKAIVWLSYNVHGNESVSTEAAMQVLFDLADPSNAETKKWLENTIVIIDPVINPDGRDRYVDWYNRVVGAFPNVNPDDWAHDEPWPGGRTNHYYFDLNRDWSWATQKETEHRLAVYNKWMPHVHVDFHEQGINQPYFFAPASKPYHEDITPWQSELQEIIGRNNARYFDANNWLYFTREVFDLFYPGYGDTWPTYNGAVGMTYEQAGSGSAGLGIVTAEGDTLTLADRIAHHHATSLSTIEASAAHSDRIVTEFARYFKSAVSDAQRTYNSYVVSRAGSADAASDLALLLDRQGILYGYAASNQAVRGFVYSLASEGNFLVMKDDLVIPARQPKASLVKILFEPASVLADSLTYDITAWAQPYAFGAAAVATSAKIATSKSVPRPAAQAVPSDKPYAYVVEWKSVRDQQFVATLLRSGVTVRMASEPFKIGGKPFDRGSIVITRAGNAKLQNRLDAIVIDAANKHEQIATPVRSGFVGNGADFGSSSFEFLAAPVVGVVGGEGISSSALGQIWYYFDQIVEYPSTIIPVANFSSRDYSDYDVLILPGGNYQSVLSDETLAGLQKWMRDGGRLVAIGSAVSFLAGKPGFDIVLRKVATDTTAVGPDEIRWADENRRRVSENVSGSIYKVAVDPTHPIGFGLGDVYYALRTGEAAYDLMKKDKGWNVGVLRDGSPVSGFAGYRTVAKLENSVAIAAQAVGRGGVVYLVDDPLYRGFWRTGFQLFGNAVFAR